MFIVMRARRGLVAESRYVAALQIPAFFRFRYSLSIIALLPPSPHQDAREPNNNNIRPALSVLYFAV